MQSALRYSYWGVAIVALLIAGCGGSGNQSVYRVSGTVKFEGKPMTGGGSISFLPDPERPGKTASGTIQSDGTYQLTTYREGDGSMEGGHRVAIVQFVDKEPEATPDGTAPAAMPAVVSDADRIPVIYSDSQQSGLRATVEPKDNKIDFDLKRDHPANVPPDRGA